MFYWQWLRAFSKRTTPPLVIAIIALVATACGTSGALNAPTPGSEIFPTVQPSPAHTATPQPVLADESGLDVAVFEQLNPRPQLRAVDRSIDFGFDEHEALPRDLINPVYTPKFVTPGDVEDRILDEELVMGLNINGDVRAYPVGIMRFREIVNDEVGGIPLLVTW